jgi:N-acetylmuramoyl-L-alanine amidase
MGKRIGTILISALLVASTLLAQQETLLQQAANAYSSAKEADKALSEKAQSEPRRSEVLKVINAYQRVYLITPHTSYADDALLAIARLYQVINDNADAVKTLKFLVHDYPQSPFKASAERDIARLTSPEESVSATPDAKTDANTGPKVIVENIRYWEAEKSLRVVVDLSGEVTFKQGEARSPDRVFIDIAHAHLSSGLVNKEWPVESGLLQKIRVGQNDAGTVRVVLDVGMMLRATSFTLRDPHRLIIDVVGENDIAVPPPVEPARHITETVPAVTPAGPPATLSAATSAATAPPEVKSNTPPRQSASAAQPTNQGNRTLIRSLGLKISRVVIDAGHGGHDTGSIGSTGFTEKELVLDVAKRLKALVESEIGAEVVLTRNDDTFVPLESRTAIANQQGADLFISIHANSSKVRSARGVETYFLNFTTSKDALETASRENAASDRSIHDLQDLVKKIVLRENMDESRELAQRVQSAMSRRQDSGPDRGVKQAPFVVLIGATMPSILAEISFISNPEEEKALKTPQYRQQIAESLLNGVRSYADTLSGVKTAKSIDKN